MLQRNTFNINRLIVVALLVVTFSAGLGHPAQASQIVLSAALPATLVDQFGPQLIATFHETYPDLSLALIRISDYAPSLVTNPAQHFTILDQLASSADVIGVRFTSLSPLDTQSGYFLDLAPLITADEAIKTEDYYPVLWQSFQWDNGMWALPVTAFPIVMGYDAAAFDREGLEHPNEHWTVDDLANAARKLAVGDTDGTVKMPGLSIDDSVYATESSAAFLRSLVGHSLVDATTVPNLLAFDTPGAEHVLTTLAALQKDGILQMGVHKAAMNIPSNDFWGTTGTSALLPGGQPILSVFGLSISAGTQYPQEAYCLARFLSARPELLLTTGPITAVKHFDRQTAIRSAPNLYTMDFTSHNRALGEQAFQLAIPMREASYAPYLLLALRQMVDQDLDAKSALLLAQQQAEKDQKQAQARTQKVNIVVATPIPTLTLKPGDLVLKFGLQGLVTPLPNLDQWERIAYDFSLHDPEVRKIDLKSMPTFLHGDDELKQYDCFYYPFNYVPDALPGTLLALDPLFSADPSFDSADFLKGVLPQVQQDHRTYALPVAMTPEVIEYFSDRLERAQVPDPGNGWTIQSFIDALKMLHTDPKDNPAFASFRDGQPLLMLMVANGALPIDYRTEPPTVNYSDSAAIEGMRQILDLAYQQYILYTSIMNPVFGSTDAPIFGWGLNTFNDPDARFADVLKWTTYPTGKYNPVAFDVAGLYITQAASNPQACYRWISVLAQHPELFYSMPVRKSQLDIAWDNGLAMQSLANRIQTLLSDPATIVIPLPAMRGTGMSILNNMPQRFLFRAFDEYVLYGKDLEVALKDAETRLNAYNECKTKLPTYNSNSANEVKEYIKQLTGCAKKVDPDVWRFLPPMSS